MRDNSSKRALFKLYALLTLVFLYAQIFIYTENSMQGGLFSIMIQRASIQLLLSPSVVLPVIQYIFSQFLLYGIYIFSLWYLTASIAELFSLKKSTTLTLGALIWVMSICFIISANSLQFHHSLFAIHWKNNPPMEQCLKFTYRFTSLFFAIILLLFMTNTLRRIHQQQYLKHAAAAVSVCFFVSFIYFNNLASFQKTPLISASQQKPNIILVSVEALRPDYIYQPQDTHSKRYTMPFLGNLLKTSIQFTDSYTPIAQSFPSWMSLITGKSPLHNGARSLFTRYSNIHLHDTFIEKLKDAGYETMYAVDGQRFGEITHSAGFDHIISPPYGVAELIIGAISDLPLSNLIVSSRLGQLLFPYTYANRSVITTYLPDDFINLLRNEINEHNDKPLFLGVHFSLSHWPYQWANDELATNATLPEQYKTSLSAADQQIQAFFQLLNEKQILNHAIVVLISDHGTALGLPGDRIIKENTLVGENNRINFLQKWVYSIPLPATHAEQKIGRIDTSYGYSTDILSLTQYHILLAFKGFGVNLGEPRQITSRTSLMDVGPTLLSLLHLPPLSSTDGISLTDEMINPLNKGLPDRSLFFENGFTVPEIANASISIVKVLQSSINSVDIDEQSGLFYIKDQAQHLLLKNKQRAILMGDWYLARYPANNGAAHMVLVNIKNQQWTTNLHSPFAMKAPTQTLLDQFNRYNGAEIK